MLKTQDITPDIFISPRTGHGLPPGMTRDQAAAWANDHADYVWLGNGKNNTAPADDVLAYEKPEGLRDGINLLYGDGHVEFQTMTNAKLQIAKSGGNNL
jgi:prepilin-type processing-associated H-X9-DG protein